MHVTWDNYFPEQLNSQTSYWYLMHAAPRAKTYELMTENGLSCDEVLFDNALYHAGADAILTLLQARHEQHVMVIGHNPAMAILLNRLVPEEQVQPSMMHFNRFAGANKFRMPEFCRYRL